MGKIALIALIALVLVLWLRHKVAHRAGSGDARAAPPPAPAQAQQMVACSHCGVHLPGNEAIAGASGKPYCDASHRALARDNPA